MGRLVIIGLDGVPYGLIDNLSKEGVMPNTKGLIEKGIFKKMASSLPEVSCVAWSTIITGKNPAEHGIFGFTDFLPETYNLYFPNFSHLKSKPFWNFAQRPSSVIINVPSTYPAHPLNGILISGFVSPDFGKAVYPESLSNILQDMDYRIDVNSQKAHHSLDDFLEDLDETLETRVKAYRYLWKNYKWDIFMFVFTETDRLCHFLWDAYESKVHKYHSSFLSYFKRIDRTIGEIASKMKNDDSLIMLSDHGFELLEKDVYINYFLKKKGFLKLKQGSQGDYSDIDWKTKAFALDPARIYVNLENKYPKGSVRLKDKESVIEELDKALSCLKIGNKKVISRIYRKKEIYKGPELDRAPDLVLLANKGFNLKAGMKAEQLWGKGIFTGKHSYPDAFLFVKGNFNKDIIPEKPSVCDIMKIIKEVK